VCEVGARGSLLASSAVGDRNPMVLRLTNEALLPQPPREGTRWESHGPGSDLGHTGRAARATD
jgi:hypothetical protein